MLVDCFPFFNEKSVLSLRLSELNRFVDYFVLIECAFTQAGNPKPYYFEQFKKEPEFEPFLDKIIHVKVDDIPENASGWAIENHQRNCITRGLDLLNLSDGDLIMVSDCDEIPNLELLDLGYGCQSVNMSYHVFYANLIARKGWIGTVIAPYSEYKKCGAQGLRNAKDYLPTTTQTAGWHLGYMGGKEAVYNKWMSTIEPFDKSKIPPFDEFSDEFDRKIKDGGSFLFSDKKDDSLICDKCSLDYPVLPRYLVENQDKFENLILN